MAKEFIVCLSHEGINLGTGNFVIYMYVNIICKSINKHVLSVGYYVSNCEPRIMLII